MRVLLLALFVLCSACTEEAPILDAHFGADLGLGPALEDGGGLADGGASPSEAVAFQLDPAHTGAAPKSALEPPLHPQFTVDLGGPISYPLISGGKVYVVVGGAAGPRLFALDGKTGASVWGPSSLAGSSGWAAAAEDGGRVFALDADGVLTAFDAASGAARFRITLPGGAGAFSAPPTATGGLVFITGGGATTTVFAVDGTTGAIRWSQPIAGPSHASPAVSPSGVYVTAGCGQAWDFAPATGALLWRRLASCASSSSGSSGRTPLLAGGRLLVRDLSGNLFLDAQSGAVISGTFVAGPAPAVDGALGLFLSGSTLRAQAVPSGTVAWQFVGDGALRSAPIAAGGFVYLASGSGLVYALDEASGQIAWSASLGSPVDPPDDDDLTRPLPGLGVGDGLLVVPAGHRLIAYH